MLRILGQVCAILAITLALDYILLATVFSDWKRNWADAATAYTEAYVRVSLHHDLAPNQNSMRPGARSSIPSAPTVMVSGPVPAHQAKATRASLPFSPSAICSPKVWVFPMRKPLPG